MKANKLMALAAGLCLLSSVAAASIDKGPCKSDKDCPGGSLCRAHMGPDGRTQVHTCLLGEQGDDCPKDTAGKGSSNCSGNLACRNVVKSGSFLSGKPTWEDYRCVGRGLLNDLCAETDAYAGSKSCGGNLVCRASDTKAYNPETKKNDLDEYHCYAPVSKKQGESCLKSDAGKGSIDCEGNLVCRNTSTTPPADYRCVGRGKLGDDCAADDAHAGSKSCGGDLVCRVKFGEFRYTCQEKGKGKQGDRCEEADAGHGSVMCEGSLVCRDTGTGHFCVGRGNPNDLCAKVDDHNGSKSCGGKLTCQNTGNYQWNCVGSGNNGDLCTEAEAGKGSWNCGGKMKCRKEGDGKYRCR